MSTKSDRGALRRIFGRGESGALDRLVREGRSDWVPPLKRGPGGTDHLEEAERKLFARIDACEGQARPPLRLVGSSSLWRPIAVITAAAAGLVFFARPHGGHVALEADRAPLSSAAVVHEPVAAPQEPARSAVPVELSMVTGGGELRVDNARVVGRGASLHDGETAEARGGEAVLAAPGRVSWLLETGTEVTVVHAGTSGGAIVLALGVGAVEAQVTPVPSGEAFAVDVDGVRIAVHGTHLRVARQKRGGTSVVVDLTEGVISVGAPPRAGTTVGVLVTAPAHVEFSVSDLSGTLRVEHDVAHVRAPVDPVSLARPATPALALPRAVEAPSSVASPAAPSPRVSSAPAPKPPNSDEVIGAAIRACADQTLPDQKGAATMSSTLTVNVNPDGVAGIATFDPPVKLEFHDCVTRAVYEVRWSEPGLHRIPIEIDR